MNLGFSAELGFKAPAEACGAEGSIGIESKWQSSQEIEIRYPVSDIDVDYFTIYYHYPFVLPHNNNLYGFLNEEEFNCSTIVDLLN